ncbi:MAG: hypothetical protein ABF689_06845 [Gluconobacter cerinus]|uniref:hypothetical protein n=1 Tax=Gluconobacter cerinus TaxID=38307 RepID=UPI0039E8D174
MEGQVKRVIVYFIALLAIGGVISYISPDIPAKFSVPNQTEEQASPAAKKPQEAWIHALSYQTSPDKDGPSERIVPGDWLLQYDANNVPQMIFTSGQQSLTIYPVPDPGIRLGATFVVSQQLIAQASTLISLKDTVRNFVLYLFVPAHMVTITS